ncbi:hypothetical protein E5Q_05730 [Mixia osmundae IAM 14324]|uniref:4-hydroxy-3-methoxy-5-polyprenylbenzoate decarboxylase n=1 Tax=Mixia osmundae (strain CBS 9802 / IAM 14324 / JCM 22182 / KY 12970) TaxID=764103 RepID=G7E881_MIXOS|nr:hypothetical protein E5Q_05730 [Mixia osmundae IAM 14324]
MQAGVRTARPSLAAQRRHRASVAYAGHVPLNLFENGLLAVGSALASLNNPHRGDMIAVLSETTGGPFLERLRLQMLESPSGRQLLKERPRITSTSANLPELAQLPSGTLGKAYCDWLEWCKVTPDTRAPVRFIDDPELAYVMQRYRECHDFYHVITGFPVSVPAEIVVKWFELANMGLPVAALSAVFGPARLSSVARRRLFSTYVPWALRCGSTAKPLINVYWERLWSTPLADIKADLGINEPPISWRDYKKAGVWR